jgi:malate/lactate dehydrogenase
VNRTWQDDPGTLLYDDQQLRETWERVKEAIREIVRALHQAAAAIVRAVARWVRPHLHGRHVHRSDRVQRRAERRRLARMLRQQRRAR